MIPARAAAARSIRIAAVSFEGRETPVYEDVLRKLELLAEKTSSLRRSLDIPRREKEIGELKARLEDPAIWSRPEEAASIGSKLKREETLVKSFLDLESQIQNATDLAKMADEEGDPSLLDELTKTAANLESLTREMELRVYLSGKYDASDAILSLHSGAGGTDAMDWVEMLYRMYTRWAERRGYSVETLDMLPGEEAGLKSVSFLVKGDYAYGYLRGEKGVHRLVRISPFDASGRRHTSFASVDVLPDFEEDVEVEINPDDLKIDTFRSSGAGGQHVNKTDSAVRITHLPTGIVVTCQNERSQHSNRLVAMRILKAKLRALKEEERRKEIESLRGPHKEIAWGNQIRSYVLQPFTLVKDHRTDYETGNVQRVLDGDIDDFIYAFLKSDLERRGLPERSRG
ncbi:MAG TPA: peptide chain release factor 2 [Firmicutes bacterium]|nr:peptide chain release factor 2 [Candidatus Fermentithermobacillaceae bacterium]